MTSPTLTQLLTSLDGALAVSAGAVTVADPAKLRAHARTLAAASALGGAARRGYARWLIWEAALAGGITPASIHELYMARGRGETATDFTVPAINLRALSFDAARAVFRAARSADAGAILFEIARSEMTYTDQRPAEYAASVLAAAIAEGHTGPVYIQGDHFQVSGKKYAADPGAEVQGVKLETTMPAQFAVRSLV
ncbi:MAG: aldolase, partial [Chloroflexi bacterium]|nr:aldolase [Chloroflexota bacterium]